MNKETKRVPVLPLRGVTVFPETVVHFDVGRPKSLKAVEECMKLDEMMLVVAQRDVNIDEPVQEDLYEVGTLVKVKQVAKLKEDQIKVLVKGEKRVRILSIDEDQLMWAEVEVIKEEDDSSSEDEEAMLRTVGELFERYAELNPRVPEEVVYGILSLKDSTEMMDIIISNIVLEVEKKQEILECVSKAERMYKVIAILEKEIQILEVQKKIYTKVKKSIDESQKEYFLREQLKMIQEELGNKDGVGEDIQNYKQKMETSKLPEEVTQKLNKEMNKLRKLTSVSPESGMTKNYIETVLDVPWNNYTKETIDLKKANTILEKEHFGLTKIKERVLEYMAIKKISSSVQVPILCLVGPPGVGKTSIARSIAHATGRNYVRISLGGVRDEAEIRGHRRTYVGAIAGRFVAGLTEAKSMNPVMVLDEIDKMAGDFRGDPAAALLEVLDSSQNSHFRDHYLELPLDLSKVMFIATANNLSTIPKPLLDRMEIIEVTSYTEPEKLQIAKKYLLPRQLEKHGLTSKNLKLTVSHLSYITEHYTKEAGVRNLERTIAKLCRRVAKEMVEKDVETISMSITKIKDYLGMPIYTYEMKNDEPEVGIVRGLAWTSVGGDTLSVEVNTMPGKGKLELTGQMGDVMKESARAALSYIRSKAEKLEIKPDFYDTYDIHIHIPEGAVPKDGPSAGITMATAMISALTGKPIRADLAMTGEITIRGHVLAIGGLKEKLLAAKRANIYDIIIPRQNEKTIKEIDASILEGLHIIYAATMDEVLEHVFAL